ncbi:MAG: XkdX family protein [Sarcina sp.]
MDFNTWKEFYGWGFATIEQLEEAVKENLLTASQFTEITGQAYEVSKVVKSEVSDKNKLVHDSVGETKESDTSLFKRMF